MKNLSIGLNVLLLIAVIVLYILHFSGNSKSTSNQGGTVTMTLMQELSTLTWTHCLTIILNRES